VRSWLSHLDAASLLILVINDEYLEFDAIIPPSSPRALQAVVHV
jgi:hypothetical protein